MNMRLHSLKDRALVGGVRMDDPELVRQVEACWLLMGRLGLKYADLTVGEEDAG